MASPDELLQATTEKENYQRIARLLICGGTSLLRDIFDTIYPPSDLALKLQDPGVQKNLKAAKLTKPERDALYPGHGKCVKSTDLDISLVSKLLRNICNLPSPGTGWDDPPHNMDHSLVADLVRIRIYRNHVCHKYPQMEIGDGEFMPLWKDIRMALLRIVNNLRIASHDSWKEAIDKFLNDPLTEEAEKNVKELHLWYIQDKDVKEDLDALKRGQNEMSQQLEGASQVMQEKLEGLGEQLRRISADLQRRAVSPARELGGE